MSKSGVFAHFGSREELQISVIREYHARFEEEVFFPAMREPRGLPRLRALFERWVRRVSVELDSGCIYISGAVEFDDRPGPVRDALAEMVRAWHAALERAIRIAVAEGHLRADTDPHADAVRDARPDPGAAPRRALPAHARRARPRARAASSAHRRTTIARRAAGATPARTAPLQPSFPGVLPCPSTPRRCATCSSCCTSCCDVADELKTLPRHADIDADTHQRGARGRRQVRRRGGLPAQHQRRPPRAARSTRPRTR